MNWARMLEDLALSVPFIVPLLAMKPLQPYVEVIKQWLGI